MPRRISSRRVGQWGPVPRISKRAVERVEARVRPGRDEESPEDDDRRQCSADRAQPGQSEPPEDQEGAQEHLQHETRDLHPHHDLRARHRDVHRADRPEHQGGGQGEADDPQIPRHQRLHRGRSVEPREPWPGKGEEQAAADGEQQGQPQALDVAHADGGVAPPAMVLGDDGIERVDRAQEAHEDARVDARPQPHRGEVGGRGMPGQHGVDDRVEHHRHLADEDRPRLGEDAPRDRRTGRVYQGTNDTSAFALEE